MAPIDLLDLFCTISIKDEYSDGINSASTSVSNFSDKLKSGLATAAKAGAAAIGAASAAVTAFAKSSVDTGKEFDSAVSQLAATMGTTVDQIQELRDKAQEMGAATSFSATEAAEGLNILAMAGLSASEQIEGINTVLDLAAAGALSMESAASYAVGAVKGFGDEISNVQYYADLMAKGATLANTSVQGLGEAMSTSAATAASYGQTAESVTLALLRLADQNVTGTEASTALNRAMADLYAPTDSAKTALSALGVSVYDSAGNARDLNDVVNDLSAALSGMSAEQATAYKSTIFTTQGLSAFNKMAVSSEDTIARFSEGLDNAFGSAAAQAATQLDNLAGDMTIFQSAMEGAQIILSDKLTPSLREFVQFGTEGVGKISTAFQEGGLSGAMDAFSEVLGDGLTMILNKVPEFLEAGGQLLLAIGNGMVSSIGQVAPVLMEAALAFMSNLGAYLKENLPALLQSGLEMLDEFTGSLRENAGVLVDAALEFAKNLAAGLAAGIPTIIEQVPGIVSNIANIINDNAPKMLAAAAEIIGQLAIGLIAAIPTLIANLPEIIAAIWNVITAVNWISLGSNIIQGIGNGIKSMGSFAKSSMETIKTALKDGISKLPETFLEIGKNIIQGLINGVKSMASTAVQAVKDVGGSIVSSVTDFLGIHSPSTVFADIGKYMVLGLEKGWEDNFDLVKSDITNSLDFGTANVDFASSGLGMSSAGIINSVSAAGADETGGTTTINLVLQDGSKIASWQLPYLIKAAQAAGTPIASGQYA